jgi:hypothetical protein
MQCKDDEKEAMEEEKRVTEVIKLIYITWRKKIM